MLSTGSSRGTLSRATVAWRLSTLEASLAGPGALSRSLRASTRCTKPNLRRWARKCISGICATARASPSRLDQEMPAVGVLEVEQRVQRPMELRG
jgi:hypothetical protein